MMFRTISRRGLVATAIGGAVAWLGGYVPFLIAPADRKCSIAINSELIALCSDLCYPRTIGKACLLVLPASESTMSSLARTILADLSPVGLNHSQPNALTQLIRERSRADFRNGKVVNIHGWILSRTEARVYALAALLPEPHASEA